MGAWRFVVALVGQGSVFGDKLKSEVVGGQPKLRVFNGDDHVDYPAADVEEIQFLFFSVWPPL